MSCAGAELGAMLFILHPGNISIGYVAATAAAVASHASLMMEYQAQSVPWWTNATQVNNST